MLAALRSHGARELRSSSRLSSLFAQFSTSAQPNFMVDYLVNTVGLSKEEAISASTKVNHLKSTTKPDLVLNYFKQCGLDQTQIKNIICSSPDLLLRKVDVNLEPKIKILRDLGFSGSNLANLLKRASKILNQGLESHIIPNINYLRQILGSDEKVVKAISNSVWFISSDTLNRMPPNISLLRSYGFSNERIETFVMRYPRAVMLRHEVLEDAMRRVECEFGISRDSPMFLHTIHVFSWVSKPNLERRFAIYRSFGWSNSDICTMVKLQPLCLANSEAKTLRGLNFFMNELGYTPAYLACHPKFLCLSFEKRVFPRMEVLKILEEKKLMKKRSLFTVVCLSELAFVKNFVLRYKDEIPNLYETYTNSMKHSARIVA